MDNLKKTIKVYYEDWQKLKFDAVEREISIADLLEELLKSYEKKRRR